MTSLYKKCTLNIQDFQLQDIFNLDSDGQLPTNFWSNKPTKVKTIDIS